VSLSVKEETLEVVLDKIFADKFQWEQVDNLIVVKPREVRVQQQQMIRVTGQVTDENGQPLPGVTVLLKGTTLGTATDPEGKYGLTIPKGEVVLLFSMVGMEDVERKAASAGEEIRIDVVMKNVVNELDDVVVTGYFNKSKNSFTGAVTQAKREELRKFGNVNLIQALSMVDPSFKIKENNLMGSDPNTLPDFFVRGESSFMGESNIPTFIVDGYEVTLQRVFDMDMDRIKVYDIEDILPRFFTDRN
ncbi:MAG: carboxypeptidase-like regulatory domain-containing protein, partial [Odoribacter splanchnicus]